LLLAVALRLPNLTSSLWLDELWATHVMLGSLIEMLHTIEWDFHPPLYALLSFFWIQLFGDSELSVRFPPLVFALGTIGLTYSLARRWFGPGTASLAAVLLTLSPVHIWYSQEARAYSLGMFLVLLLIWSYYQMHEAQAGGWWLLTYGSVALAAVQTDFFLMAFPGSLTAVCAIRRCRLWKQVLGVSALAAFSLAVFLVLKSLKASVASGLGYLRPLTPYELWLLFFHWFSTGNTLWSVNPYAGPSVLRAEPALLAVQLLLCVLFVIGLIRCLRSPIARAELPLLLFGLPVALMILSLVWRNIYIERSLLAVLPLFLIVLASGITAVRFRRVRVGLASGCVALSVAASMGLYLRSDDWTVYKPKSDWRSAAAYLDAAEPASRLPIFAAYSGAPELTYYRPWIRETRDASAPAAAVTEVPMPPDVAQLGLLQFEQNPCEAVNARKAGGLFIVHTGPVGQSDPPFDAVVALTTRSGQCELVDREVFRALEIFKFVEVLRSSS
jgi:hypothetical protein